MIVRLYTGEDGQSHFEDIDPRSGGLESIGLATAARVTFHRFPDGFFADWHTAPRRLCFIILLGRMELVTGAGALRTLEAGDMLLEEDVTGQGHTLRIAGGPHVAVSMPLSELPEPE